jgi:hypothetical protein
MAYVVSDTQAVSGTLFHFLLGNALTKRSQLQEQRVAQTATVRFSNGKTEHIRNSLFCD